MTGDASTDVESPDDIDLENVGDMSLEEIAEAGDEGDDEFWETESHITTHDIVDVPLNKLTASSWNPNEMSNKQFDRLCASIEEDGFMSALQAVPVDEDGEIMDTGGMEASEIVEEMEQARIVGGEHRWSAAKVVGMKDIPVALVPDVDEQWEQMATIRMNALSGEIDPVSFADLVEDYREQFSEQELKRAMGFTGDETLLDQVLDDVKEAVPDEIQDELEEHADEVKTIDDLSEILNQLFREHGEQLEYNFMVFEYGGQKNVMYQIDRDLWHEIEQLNNRIESNAADAMEFWREVVQSGDVIDSAIETAIEHGPDEEVDDDGE